jgi:hypothetical protein
VPTQITTRRAGVYWWPLFLLLVAVIFFAFGATASAADVPPPQTTLPLPADQFWPILIAVFTPLPTYLLNHYAPWASEQVKGIVQVSIATAVGVAYPLIANGTWDFDVAHLEIVGSAILSALLAHKLLYAPAGINVSLKASPNA